MAWTYTTLKNAVQDYLETTETTFVNNLGVIVQQAEDRILKTIQLPDFRKNVTGNTTDGTAYLSMPSDFLAPYSLAVDNSGYEFLLFKDVSFIREAYPVGTTEGIPKHYAVFDENSFILGPTPNANLTAELHYFYRPASLTAGADSGTTWLSENATVSLLYGSLVEAYTYMKGEQDLITNYQQRFMEGIATLKQFGEAKEVTDEYMKGQVIRPKQ